MGTRCAHCSDLFQRSMRSFAWPLGGQWAFWIAAQSRPNEKLVKAYNTDSQSPTKGESSKCPTISFCSRCTALIIISSPFPILRLICVVRLASWQAGRGCCLHERSSLLPGDDLSCTTASRWYFWTIVLDRRETPRDAATGRLFHIVHISLLESCAV